MNTDINFLLVTDIRCVLHGKHKINHNSYTPGLPRFYDLTGLKVWVMWQYSPCTPDAEVFLALEGVDGQGQGDSTSEDKCSQHYLWLVESHCKQKPST